jgi:putative glutamine amidotransferase
VNRSPTVLVTSTTEIIRGVSRVRVNEAYTDALAAAGLVPLVLPPLAPGIAVRALDYIAGLVLTGGEDLDPAHYDVAPHSAAGQPHAARDACELALARVARDRAIPTLAICRGAQVINVAFGGTLIQDIPSERSGTLDHDPRAARRERVHSVYVESESELARAIGASEIATNSSHHQAVDRLGDGLRVTARTTDGIVEAFESVDAAWWMVAVQWHPEELTETPEDWDRRLFAAFAERVSREQLTSVG